MNSKVTSAGPKRAFNWRDDLSASRDLSRNDVQAFGFVVGWFEEWRVRAELPPGRESAREFWRVAVKSKPRQDWQLKQWTEGMRWYLNEEIYAHAARIGNDKGVRSPLDALGGGRALDLDHEAVRQGDGTREDDGCEEEDEDWDED